MPFFSVIIPLYNKAPFIQKTLDSVLSQVFLDYEIIIVNDGSTDTSLELIKLYTDSKINIINQENQGVSAARNNGILAANGKFIAFLDADDYWTPTHLKELKKTIELWPNEVVFCTNYDFVFDNNKIKRPNFSIHLEPDYTIITDYFKSSMNNSIVMTPSACIKKSILMADFLFDVTIKSGQDTDLWIRLGQKFNFVFINKITLKINRSVPNSLSKSKLIDDRLYAIEKHRDIQSKNNSLHKYLDYNRFSIALQYKRIGDSKSSTNVIKSIDNKNLSTKQRILLQLPRFIIRSLDRINNLR